MPDPIPPSELRFRATRAGGPGGQHVNTSSTRVEAAWDVAHSAALNDADRARIMAKLANRIGADGVLRVTAAERRSQLQNKEAAIERINALVTQALKRPKPRKRSRPPRAAREARLRAKQHRADTKRGRGRVSGED